MKKFVHLLYTVGVVLAAAGAVAAQTGSPVDEARQADVHTEPPVSEFVESSVTQVVLPACAFAAMLGGF